MQQTHGNRAERAQIHPKWPKKHRESIVYAADSQLDNEE
jgi:hypothetical protein